MRHLSEVNLNEYTLKNLNGIGSKAKEKKININDNDNTNKDNTNSNINSNKNSLDKKYLNHSQKRSRSKSIVFRENNCLSKRMDILANINISNFSESPLVNNKCMKGFLNEIEIMKINENIHNDINFIHLKKKISQLKKNIQNKNSKEFSKFKSNMSPSHSKTNSSLNKKLNVPGKKNDKINAIEERDENNEIILQKEDNTNNNTDVNKENSKKNLITLSKNSTKKVSINKDKFRLLIRRKDLYDSFDDEEYKEEEIDYYIAPDSWYIRLFDFFLFISSMVYFIFVPYFLSINYFINDDNKIWKIIFLIIDIIYIIDILINFFRAYKNFDENLIRRTKKIILHYLKTWFLLDFIQAVPYFSIIKYLEKVNETNSIGCKFIEYRAINAKIYVLLLIKIIKVYKIFYNNNNISYFSEILSRNEIIDDHGGVIIIFFITLLVLNMTTCIFIFLGINAYPAWIIKLSIQDKGYLHIYLVSLYFIIVTITTVGYGDITGQNYQEIIFQICLLIIGTIAYSFTISYISNYIIKSNNKSMSFEKNLEIL